MPRGKQINNQLRASVINSYILTNNYKDTADKLGVSPNTVKKIILDEKDHNADNFAKLCNKKKEKFSKRADKVIDKALDRLEKELENQESIPINNLTTVIGTLFDKKRLADGETTQNNSITIKMSNEVKELSK